MLLVKRDANVWNHEEIATMENHAIVSATLKAIINKPSTDKVQRVEFKFSLIQMPEITSWLLGNFTDVAFNYYQTALSEEQAEVWLHRGLEHLSLSEYRTDNHDEANIVIIPGYLHLNHHLQKQPRESRNAGLPFTIDEWLALLETRLIPGKIHLLACPTWNPTRGNEIGLEMINRLFRKRNIRWASFGFERNKFWQKQHPQDIVPVPYVVSTSKNRHELQRFVSAKSNRAQNFVFYAGDKRKHAVPWAGCNRTQIVQGLEHRTDMDVRIIHGRSKSKNSNSTTPRLSIEEYHSRMITSDYCLILCGDTPTSRSLASSMIFGCIPVRIGSRLRGYCEAPCHSGWGWTVSNISHLPFAHAIDWNQYPELDEASFIRDPMGNLNDLFKRIDSRAKEQLRESMGRFQLSWIYGWGSPVNSTDFGEAVAYALDSAAHFLLVGPK